ncbi:MAG: hypothetical protein OCD76_17465 [Reichenbachiella sp.]
MKRIFTLLLAVTSLTIFAQNENLENLMISDIKSETETKSIVSENCNISINKKIVNNVDNSKKPPIVLNVIIGDSIITLIEGNTYQLSGELKDTPLKFNVANYKLLNREGVQFAYPEQFTFKSDESTSWSIVGDDYTLFVTIFDKPFSVDEKMDELVRMYKKNKVKVVETIEYNTSFNGVPMTGKSIILSMMGTKFRQDMFTTKNGDNKLQFMISDYLTDDGNPSSEAFLALQYLDKTLKIIE